MPECFYESGTERFVDTFVSVDESASKFSVEDWDGADLGRQHHSRMGQVRAGFGVQPPTSVIGTWCPLTIQSPCLRRAACWVVVFCVVRLLM